MKRVFVIALVCFIYFSGRVSPAEKSDTEQKEYFYKEAKTLLSREKKLPQTTFVLANDGAVIGCFATERRTRLSENSIPLMLERAIIASEDKNFYKHVGLDPLAIGRAGWNDFWAGKIVEGGSTITQQVAKNYFLTNERSLDRKLKEARFALAIELFHTKRQILMAYVNKIFLGRAWGFEAAAKAYFGRSAKDLTLAQTAFIVGMINDPNILVSRKDGFEEAVGRKNRVLRLMYGQRMISYEEFRRAYWEEIKLLPPGEDCRRVAPFFVEDVRKTYKDTYPLNTGGLRIATGLDRNIQKRAEDALKNAIGRYISRHPQNAEKIQGAVVVLDAVTGEVVAMVGGANYSKNEFNNATQALRQPGSTFKPFADAAYLQYVCKGERVGCQFKDSPFPVSMGAGRGMHYVQNYPYRNLPAYRGMVNMDVQLAESRNAATMWMAHEAERAYIHSLIPQKLLEHEAKKEERIAHYRSLGYSAAGALREYNEEHAGISRGVLWDNEEKMRWLTGLAKDMGISSKLEPYLVTAIGASEVKVLDITSAFIAFFNGGYRVAPLMIRGIYDSKMQPILELKKAAPAPVFAKTADAEGALENYRIANNMKELLKGVVDLPTGTAHALRKNYPTGDIACKTGTATNERDEPTDNWIICATPKYVVGIWFGLEDKLDLGDRETGAINALPIFDEMMKNLIGPDDKFAPLFEAPQPVSPVEPEPEEESEKNIEEKNPQKTEDTKIP